MELTSAGSLQLFRIYQCIQYLLYIVCPHWFIVQENLNLCVCCVGLRAGDEILSVNGADVSALDLGLIHTLFTEQTLRLVLHREESVSDEQASVWPGCDSSNPYEHVPPSSTHNCPPPPSHSTQTQFGSSGMASQASFNGTALPF